MDQYDAILKDLIGNRDFAISFLQTYMPKELATIIEWETVKLQAANIEHQRRQQNKNVKQKE